ncbi:uncharacterized protein LOC110102413 isoform X1 [Dendrobium catenatum]|uniref:DUF7953 domain-containing protein n=2 Tax=Dendrobium catenatum TaxID=906689 RepID=A0A2I0VVL2_9ASPA|nr:uncharacterized protein LOC110102413 isoform X1 [Dendrobium catenatum]PKU67442.1 hypothetical protein MA16_Dca020337 [Dendrobium catenatum]
MRGISPCLLLVSCLLLPSISGTFSSMTVILSSVVFFNIHELLSSKPTIYFQCQAENKIILLDVIEKHFLYKFKGVESWQPLAELPDKKCKRCGFYELNREKSDDVFDEWDLCPDEFLAGNYVHYKEKEFNASFTCTNCAATVGYANPNQKSSSVDKNLNLALAILLGVLTSFVTSVATYGMYKYWQKWKREQNQARFLKLFDEGDGLEDELELDF